MLLEKYENILELSAKQLVIQSSLASSICVGQTVSWVKSQILMLLVAMLGIFPIQQELPKCKSNIIPFKRE